MTYSPQLERGYRRLLACYPRAFRRENTAALVLIYCRPACLYYRPEPAQQ